MPQGAVLNEWSGRGRDNKTGLGAQGPDMGREGAGGWGMGAHQRGRFLPAAGAAGQGQVA